ncbi:MAG: thioesterase family protein [Solirubrobacteraceae bacterium]|nr:thioesterase family protein [Solirubrobacteraceae bacterium]
MTATTDQATATTDQATAATPTGRSTAMASGGPARWPAWMTVEEATTPAADGVLAIGDDWAGFGGAFGGLLVAAAARSMASVVPSTRRLRSIHVDFQGAVQTGSLAMAPEVTREGRSVSFTRVAADQGGRTRVAATAVFGDASEGLDYAPVGRDAMPVVPPPSMCEPMVTRGTPALQTIEYRPARDPLPFARSDRAELHVWTRILGDDAPVDAARALMLLDAPAPGLYATLERPVPIPSIEFTAHLLPALDANTSSFALARMRTLAAGDGYCIDDCELWNEAGNLLATSRQLRRVIT